MLWLKQVCTRWSIIFHILPDIITIHSGHKLKKIMVFSLQKHQHFFGFFIEVFQWSGHTLVSLLDLFCFQSHTAAFQSVYSIGFTPTLRKCTKVLQHDLQPTTTGFPLPLLDSPNLYQTHPTSTRVTQPLPD